MGNINEVAANEAMTEKDYVFISEGGMKLRKASLSVLVAALEAAGIVTETPTTTHMDLSGLENGTWIETLSDGSTVNHSITFDENGNVTAIDGMSLEWPEVI